LISVFDIPQYYWSSGGCIEHLFFIV